MSEREIKIKLIDNAETMAHSLFRGKDLEIRKSATGISIAEVSKKVIKR